jgi:hypothetical protein
MGKWYDNKISYIGDKSDVKDLNHHNKVLIVNRNILELGKNGNGKNYIQPLLDIINDVDKSINNNYIAFLWGDNNSHNIEQAIIAKSRIIGDTNTILLNMNINRHWGDIRNVNKYDIPFISKKDMVVWRGVTTGSENRKGNRFDLVKKYYDYDINKIDVGFNKIVQGHNTYKTYIKNTIPINQLLEYKYIISVEGNDVASGLKWQLYSNSVVLMPKPTIESWAMEGKLKPYVHYVPLKYDFSDLKSKYNWCLQNNEICQKISINATNYIKQFFDNNNEQLISKNIMVRYFNNISIR